MNLLVGTIQPITMMEQGFPGGSDSKESVYNAKDSGLILGLGKSPGGGRDNLL